VGEKIVKISTDGVSSATQITAGGLSFDKIVFSASGNNNYLVNSIRFEASIDPEEVINYPLIIAPSLYMSHESSGTLLMTVSGLLEGTSLSAGTVNGDGSVTLTPDQLEGLTLSVPLEGSNAFAMSVSATSVKDDGSILTASVDVPVAIPVDSIATELSTVSSATTGNDTLIGGAGFDTLFGGNGIDEVDYSQDSLFGSTVGVTVDLATGKATDGFGDEDSLFEIESVKGSNFDDNLSGGAGNDILTGIGGQDILTGNAGNDTFRYTSQDESLIGSPDQITDFIADNDDPSHDLFSLDGFLSGVFSFVGDSENSFTGGGNASAKFNDASKILEIDVDGNATTDMEIQLINVPLAKLDETDFLVT
jgi:Ca2+-binding RTX toxin-like protein